MSTQFPIFAFALGREFKLSVAEIASACPECRFVSVDPKLAVVDGINAETALSIFSRLGGSVRVFEILSECTVGDFARRSTEYLKTKIAGSEGKHSFALAAFGGEVPLFDAGLRVKKALKEEDLSVRLCNVENRTINAASFKKDHLSKTRLECAYLEAEGGAKYFAVTLACQDVDEFSKRDLGKGRSMEVGMLPPKLARIMVNLTKGKKRSTDDAEAESTPGFFAIYDPFCGLGTVLIEAADLGFSSIAGSDVEPKMVESTKTSLEDYAKRKHVTFDFSIKTLDAKKIGTEKTILETAAIVTEGYLGDILTQKTATPEKIDEQKRRLIAIYRGFFSELKRIDFKNPIVMCIPFWDIGGTFTFFEEFFDILKECGYYSEKLLPESLDYYPTKF
jgi:tRNA G10  N-methylase Trm11